MEFHRPLGSTESLSPLTAAGGTVYPVHSEAQINIYRCLFFQCKTGNPRPCAC